MAELSWKIRRYVRSSILHPKVGLVCLSFDCNILDGILDTHANMDNPDDLFIGESREVVSITHARISCSRQGQVLCPSQQRVGPSGIKV